MPSTTKRFNETMHNTEKPNSSDDDMPQHILNLANCIKKKKKINKIVFSGYCYVTALNVMYTTNPKNSNIT